MKKLSYIYSFAFIMMFFCSCGLYSIRLDSVESSRNLYEDRDKSNIVSFKEDMVKGYKYSDEFLEIIWHIDDYPRILCFTLKNKSNRNIKIEWDEISYVNFDGLSCGVIHSEVSQIDFKRFLYFGGGLDVNRKGIDKNKPQLPTVIPRGAKICEMLLPKEKIGKNVDPLLIPVDMYMTGQEYYKDKNIKIYMPIVIGKESNEYIFTLGIHDVS